MRVETWHSKLHRDLASNIPFLDALKAREVGIVCGNNTVECEEVSKTPDGKTKVVLTERAKVGRVEFRPVTTIAVRFAPTHETEAEVTLYPQVGEHDSQLPFKEDLPKVHANYLADKEKVTITLLGGHAERILNGIAALVESAKPKPLKFA